MTIVMPISLTQAQEGASPRVAFVAPRLTTKTVVVFADELLQLGKENVHLGALHREKLRGIRRARGSRDTLYVPAAQAPACLNRLPDIRVAGEPGGESARIARFGL